MAEPPEDAPSPEEQDEAVVEAGFEEGPPVAELCGFKIPFFIPTLSINLPAIVIPFPPDFFFDFSFGINCDTDNPIDVSAGVGFGGGRQPRFERDPDLVDEAA